MTATCELCGGTGLRGVAGEQKCDCGAVPPSPRLLDLLDQYWSIAYQQGVEGRTHDNEAGDAQRVLSEITAALALLPSAPEIRMIKLPTSADEAEAMEKTGFAWLREHAPERLTVEGMARPIPHLSVDREALLEEARQILVGAEEFVIDGITELKSHLEMNLPYPSRAARFQTRLDDARKIYASMKSLYSKLEGSSNAKS